MYLIQLFLPLYNNAKQPIPKNVFAKIESEMVTRFGGLTAYTRSPASGLWQDDAEHTTHDDLIIYEVMAEILDQPWWRQYRAKLEQQFQQDTLLIRAQEVHIL